MQKYVCSHSDCVSVLIVCEDHPYKIVKMNRNKVVGADVSDALSILIYQIVQSVIAIIVKTLYIYIYIYIYIYNYYIHTILY